MNTSARIPRLLLLSCFGCPRLLTNLSRHSLRQRRILYLPSSILTLLASASIVFAQGNLTPPAGPPAPTMKTLDEVEPRANLQNAPASAITTTDLDYHFIITQPGSHYLSANLGVTKPNGIQINAEGVTVDLNGFQISRASGSGGNGIEIGNGSHRASIRNGSIKGFATGIDSPSGQTTASARGCTFRDLAVSGCTNAGIFTSEGAVVESCRAHDNSGSYGIYANDGSTLSNCTAHNNTTTYGIFADTASTLINCTATANTSAASVSAGIGTNPGCTIVHCTSSINLSSAGTSTPTSGMGFDVGLGSTIQNCTARANRGDGIRINSDTAVSKNCCVSNGNGGDGAGIHSISSDNRIEANHVTDNDRGLDVDFTDNLIIKNSASGNTINYDIVAVNIVGTIVATQAAMNAATNSNVNVSF